MKKNDFRGFIVAVIVLVVFNVLSFVIPFTHTVGFWLGYAFGMLAIIIQLPLLYLAFRKEDTPRSRFYGFPIAQVGGIYLVVQLILSIVGMAFGAWIPVWIIVVVYVVLLGVAAIGFVAVDAMRDEIQRQDVLLANNVAAMRNLQSKANTMWGLYEDRGYDIVRKLVEEIRYSDPVSNEATVGLEMELENVLDELQKALSDGDHAIIEKYSKKALGTLAERNRLCKVNK